MCELCDNPHIFGAAPHWSMENPDRVLIVIQDEEDGRKVITRPMHQGDFKTVAHYFDQAIQYVRTSSTAPMAEGSSHHDQ